MSQEKPLNVLWITSDQQHFTLLGCKNPEVETPNLDRLAKRGTLFNRAYCPNPTCTPTRASMITGQHPNQHGAWSLGTKLPESAHTVGHDFQKAGYDSVLIGKAHFQPLKSTEEFPSLESYPLLQDLEFWKNFKDDFYGFNHIELTRNHTDEAHVGQHYAIWMEEKGYANWRDYYSQPTGNSERQKHKWNIPEEIHYNTWIAERTNAKLDQYQKSGQPFFLWSSFFDPHPSYLVPEPWDTYYDPEKITVPKVTPGEHDKSPEHIQKTQTQNPDYSDWEEEGGNGMHGCSSHLHDEKVLAKNIAVYYGMMTLLDKYVGKILDHLEETGLAENTLVVFTTDHGHYFGQHGLIAKGPFHYEDAVKVPFIASLPGKIKEGVECDALQSLIDLPVTSLSMAGLPVPRTMVGVDQSKVWAGEKEQARDHVLVEHHHQPTTIHLNSYINERYKITRYCNRDYGEIFDLKNDPGEINNLWDDPAYKELKAELTEKLLNAKMRDEPLWMPRVAGA